jgi:hypothetical protein
MFIVGLLVAREEIGEAQEVSGGVHHIAANASRWAYKEQQMKISDHVYLSKEGSTLKLFSSQDGHAVHFDVNDIPMLIKGLAYAQHSVEPTVSSVGYLLTIANQLKGESPA